MKISSSAIKSLHLYTQSWFPMISYKELKQFFSQKYARKKNEMKNRNLSNQFLAAQHKRYFRIGKGKRKREWERNKITLIKYDYPTIYLTHLSNWSFPIQKQSQLTNLLVWSLKSIFGFFLLFIFILCVRASVVDSIHS